MNRPSIVTPLISSGPAKKSTDPISDVLFVLPGVQEDSSYELQPLALVRSSQDLSDYGLASASNFNSRFRKDLHEIARTVDSSKSTPFEEYAARVIRDYVLAFGISSDESFEALKVALVCLKQFNLMKVMLRNELASFGFSEHNEYMDVLGGFVMDSYREDERITCVVSSNIVQILSHINNCTASREFTIQAEAQGKVESYVRTLLE